MASALLRRLYPSVRFGDIGWEGIIAFALDLWIRRLGIMGPNNSEDC